MEPIDCWIIDHANAKRTIQLLHGDLAHLPPQEAVDILVVSAFANDYLETHTSLIGALAETGLQVGVLAKRKAIDLREQYSCWLSQPIDDQYAFNRVLCIESGWRGSPPEITDDLFRALAPILLGDCPNATVAMPLIGTGDQGWPPDRMLESIVNAAVSWIHRGLPLQLLKIVVYSDHDADVAKRKFVELKRRHEGNHTTGKDSTASSARAGDARTANYDIFLSYCRRDTVTAETIKRSLEVLRPDLRIFFDRTALNPGVSWLTEIAESLDNARKVAALFTPNYWTSKFCKDEFAAAFARQIDTGQDVLFPIYFASAKVPYLFGSVQAFDCRESDMDGLSKACIKLARTL